MAVLHGSRRARSHVDQPLPRPFSCWRDPCEDRLAAFAPPPRQSAIFRVEGELIPSSHDRRQAAHRSNHPVGGTQVFCVHFTLFCSNAHHRLHIFCSFSSVFCPISRDLAYHNKRSVRGPIVPASSRIQGRGRQANCRGSYLYCRLKSSRLEASSLDRLVELLLVHNLGIKMNSHR